MVSLKFIFKRKRWNFVIIFSLASLAIGYSDIIFKQNYTQYVCTVWLPG